MLAGAATSLTRARNSPRDAIALLSNKQLGRTNKQSMLPGSGIRVLRVSSSWAASRSIATSSREVQMLCSSIETRLITIPRFPSPSLQRMRNVLKRSYPTTRPSIRRQAAVIPLLDLSQRQNKGWTSISVMNYVAKLLELPPMRVYEVATFYTMFNREPIGDNCLYHKSMHATWLDRNPGPVVSHLNLKKPGETTKDGKFTVIEVECQGACSNAPMLVVWGRLLCLSILEFTGSQEDLTPASTKKILDSFAKGQKPKPGPQSGRHTSENSAGLTSLMSKPRLKQPFRL
ncbi:thioredoxin-like [2Fe-2S] ferredoxin-domain-containing protein [Gautieria morchelliformis]|nr:thioredoxin-like [2Fe-2S] ferredoxin-domain-containing protein [Gautieria morchelliformis]